MPVQDSWKHRLTTKENVKNITSHKSQCGETFGNRNLSCSDASLFTSFERKRSQLEGHVTNDRWGGREFIMSGYRTREQFSSRNSDFETSGNFNPFPWNQSAHFWSFFYQNLSRFQQLLSWIASYKFMVVRWNHHVRLERTGDIKNERASTTEAQMKSYGNQLYI